MTQQSFHLVYRSQRKEVWNWYWNRWRTNLWRQWLVSAAAIYAVSLFMGWQDHRALDATDILLPTVLTMLLFTFFALFPQLAFKIKERALDVDENGIRTTIGSQTATRSWREISEVLEDKQVIILVVKKSGNAFLVPDRAFSDRAQRNEFLSAVRNWHSKATLV